MEIIELDIDVEDVDEFNSEATELLEEFTDELSKEACMTRPITEEDGGDTENFLFMWTDAAVKLINAKELELISIGRKYFKESDIDISNSYVTEP